MADEELGEEESVPMTAGQRLREAREAAGLSLEEIATSTRIPTRHLESLEAGDFSRLPAPTYSIGFAKNYAGAVGLDRTEIGDQLRAEMGSTRPTYTTSDVFEPADPARQMPKWLIVGAVAAILLAALGFNWWSNRSLEAPDELAEVNEVVAAAPATQTAPATPQAQGPVVITATDRAWVEIKDGDVILKQGELAAGEVFQVPANALSPTLTTAKPEALRIAVGTSVAPTVGEPARRVTVSLKGEDLLRAGPATAAAAGPAAPPPASVPARAAPVRRPAPPPAAQPQPTTVPPPAEPAPAEVPPPAQPTQ